MADAKADLNAAIFGQGAPLEELDHSSGGTASLTYPSELTESGEHFIKFMPIKYERKNRNQNATLNTLMSIHLPIPANIATSYAANWGEAELGQIGNLMADGGSKSRQLMDELMAGNVNKDTFKKSMAAGGEVFGAVKPNLIRNTVKALGDFAGVKAVEAYDVTKGQTVNPHQAALFTGIGFRTHSFAYKLLARSPKESETINNIIKTIKYCMHPDIIQGGTMFEFPYEWIIKFSSSVRKYAYDFTPCAMTSFNTTYNGQGIPVFYEGTGAPIQVDISMQFKEVEIITKSKLKKEGRGDTFGKGSSQEAADLNAANEANN
jgi:hypothetical protein